MKTQFCQLAEFLSQVLGPAFSLAYYDLEDIPHMKATCSYGYNNPQQLNQISEQIPRLYADGASTGEVYRTDLSHPGSPDYRHSIFYVRDEKGADAGVLVLSTNQAEKLRVLSALETLLHVQQPAAATAEITDPDVTINVSTDSLSKLVYQLLQERGLDPGQNLSPNQKIEIVTELNRHNAFKLKGAVPAVAQLLNTSIPTIYRYLSKLNQQSNNIFWEPINLV